MPFTLLIAVTDVYDGYGDFLFALKLSQSLRQAYEQRGHQIPLVYIVTTKEGNLLIEMLKGNIEFQTDILTMNTLKDKLSSGEIIIDYLIEGPVFHDKFISEIDCILTKNSSQRHKTIPLLMATEYSVHHREERLKLKAHQNYRKTVLQTLSYKNIIYSGLNCSFDEQGLLIQQELSASTHSVDVWLEHMDARLRQVVLGREKTFANYERRADLFFQYSHDQANLLQCFHAEHFLRVHAGFSKASSKNQDIIMLGKDIDSKIMALQKIKRQLFAAGFTKIIFFDVEHQEKMIINSPHENGSDEKIYRVIYLSRMSHPSMLACMALSSPLIGVTGDQSLGEAISFGKTIVYECLEHKQDLIHDYDVLLNETHDTSINRLVKLLRSHSNNPAEYDELGNLIRRCHAQLNTFNQQLSKKYNLVSCFFDEIEFEPTLVKLLQRGDQEQALAHFFKKNQASIYAKYDGKEIIQYALENNSHGVFSRYFEEPQVLLWQYLLSQSDDALHEFLKTQAMDLFFKLKKKTFFEHCIDLERFSVVNTMIESLRSNHELKKLYSVLNLTNSQGRPYLSLMIEHDRYLKKPATEKILLVVLFYRVMNYVVLHQFDEQEKRLRVFGAIIKFFYELCHDDLNAFVGLLFFLLPAKHHVSMQLFALSKPTSDDEFYRVIKKALGDCGIDETKRQLFIRRFYSVLNTSSQLIANQKSFRFLFVELGINSPLLLRSAIDHEQAKIMLLRQTIPLDMTDVITNQFKNGFYCLCEELLGQGGWGKVYIARHYTLQDKVLDVSELLALKIIEKGHDHAQEFCLFKRAYPKGHYDYWQTKDNSYFVMPLFSGIPLDTYLQHHDDLSLQERKKLLAQLISNLSQIHEQGIVHCDLKSKNMLWDPIQQCMTIVDFGCAEELGVVLCYHDINTAKFAIEYMPPEYLSGMQAATSADIYSLSLVVAEILGLSLQKLTQVRVSKALEAIDNALFSGIINELLVKLGTLDAVLFSQELTHYLSENNSLQPILIKFILIFVRVPYDFSPYRDELGETTAVLLEQMLSMNFNDRPGLAECRERLLFKDVVVEHESESRCNVSAV